MVLIKKYENTTTIPEKIFNLLTEPVLVRLISVIATFRSSKKNIINLEKKAFPLIHSVP